jgi:hypothetical protein
MTDAKQRLRALDRLDTPDVWERALSLEPTSELDGSAEHPTRKRVVAIVVAFAVFAAAAAFAWQGFRSSTPTPAGPPDAISSTVLWPERTKAALTAAQASVDAGDPGTAWRTDPEKVAARFAEDVLGWGPAETPFQGGVAVSYVVTLADGATTGSAEVRLDRLALPCPSPAPGTASTCPPPFEDEVVTLRQEAATGDAGIWSVTEVRADGLRLDAQPGGVIQYGDPVTGSLTFPPTAPGFPDFSATSGVHIGVGHGCSSTTASVGIGEGSVSLVTRPIPPQGGGSAVKDCGPTPGAYIWIATGANSSPSDDFALDPLDLTAQGGRAVFYGLTLVPVQIAIPENGTGSPTSGPLTFAGELRCPAGEKAGGAIWDYGSDVRGTIVDPTTWVRESATGLDPALKLSFVKEAGDRDNVVLATSADGSVLAFVDFGVDKAGEYFPNDAEACPSSGIEDFNGHAK